MALFWHVAIDALGFMTTTIQEIAVPDAGPITTAYPLRNALQSDWDEVTLLAHSDCLEHLLREHLREPLQDPTWHTQDQNMIIDFIRLQQFSRVQRILGSREEGVDGLDILGVPGTAIPARIEPELWPEIAAAVINI